MKVPSIVDMHSFASDLFLVVELDVPFQEECAAKLLDLEGDVERDGDDVVEEHQERDNVVENGLWTAACIVKINHVLANFDGTTANFGLIQRFKFHVQKI